MRRRAHPSRFRPRRRGRRSETPPGGDEPSPRLLGRIEYLGGAPWFLPARRFPRGRRRLAFADGRAPEAGDYVIAECPWDGDAAELVEVLGREDDPGWDDLAVLSRHRWPRRFRREAQAEADAAAAPEGAPRGREDLRDRPAFTMDPADAADFDDALSWRALGGGRAEVGVHVADVGAYVRPGGALDEEARERGTSVYLASRAVPMLPERLSSDLCSLRPACDRFALSVLVEMDGSGEVLAYRIHRSTIRSRARLGYEDGQAFLDGSGSVPAEIAEGLRALSELAAALRRRRRARGALDLATAEVRVAVGPEGRPTSLERKRPLGTHGVIEEFMLLANTLIGEEAQRRGGPFLWRVHDRPAPERIEQLDRQLRALGLPQLGRTENVSGPLQKLLDYPLPEDRKRLVHQLALRSLARAAYRERDEGHFGLALSGYCHFTSPIRRYPDLFNHRQVAHWLAEPRGRAGRAAWHDRREEELARIEERHPGGVAGLARHATEQEGAAQAAERESVRVKSLRFMESFLGEEYEGTIVGVVPRGVFVALDAPPVEGFCRIADAVEDDFRLDDAGVRLVGRRSRRRYGLGDRLRVAVARVDVPAREMELALLAPRPRSPRAPGRRKSRRARRRSGGKT